jgi:5'-3' exonuclease
MNAPNSEAERKTASTRATRPSLHLLDATYELFRAFFAMPGERAADGTEVGAVRGLVGSVLAMLRDDGVTHIGAATDHVIESFRNELYDGYKTGEGMEEDLFAQFPLAEDALRALGVVVWPMREFEADDALATAAARFAPVFERVVILSPDKDLCQCVRGEEVVCYDRRRRKMYDDAAVQEKFGVAPASIPDLLALVGDSADGIPGLPGFGMKTAARLLRVYGCIERIPVRGEDWHVDVRGAHRLADTLQQRRDDALLFKKLATFSSCRDGCRTRVARRAAPGVRSSV